MSDKRKRKIASTFSKSFYINRGKAVVLPRVQKNSYVTGSLQRKMLYFDTRVDRSTTLKHRLTAAHLKEPPERLADCIDSDKKVALSFWYN